MSNTSAPALRLEIRHLELGERVPDEQLTQSARHIVDQASTNYHSNDVWRSPSLKQPPIDCFSSTRYVYRQPPPNKRSLIQTTPLVPLSNIPPLLDWGSNPTELEGLGLSGLEEFRSGIKLPAEGLSAVQQSLLKRRRSIGERPQGLRSSLTKKPRFAVPRPAPSNFASPAVSARVQNAAISALQSKSSTRGSGSVRLRLGLTKRTNIGSKLEPNRPSDTPYDISVKVKLTPRHQTESRPPPFSVTESSDSSISADGTLALGFKIPDSVLTGSRNGKLQIQLPMRAPSAGSHPVNTPRITASNVPGPSSRVLVPASPSPLTDRITEVPTAHSNDLESPGSCADTSMLSDGPSEFPLISPFNATSEFPPPPSVPALPTSLLQTDNYRAQPLEGQSSNIPPEISISGSISLSLEEPGSLAQKDITPDLSSQLDTSYDLKPNQLMASVFYDSSQDSNNSQAEQPSGGANPFTTDGNYESPPWDLSQQDEQDEAQTHDDYDLRSPTSSIATKCVEADKSGPVDSGINEHSLDPSDPNDRHPNPGLISVLYDSSQDSPRPQSRNGIPSDQHDQGNDSHSMDGDAAMPMPSWSPDASLQSRTNYPLSGVPPSSSWGSLPSRIGTSTDDLVSASRSLSLEDFEVRRSSDHQLRDTNPTQSKSLAPLQLSVVHHSNIPVGPINGGHNMSPPRGPQATTDKRSGMSKLTTYATTQGSLMGSHSPILSFTPLPKPNIPDDSLESIESPDISQRINAGNSFRPNPIFRFPVPNLIAEPEEDISCESQVLQPKLTSLPHGTQTTSRLAQTPDKDPASANHGLRDDCASAVPNSDGASAHERQAPASMDEAVNRKITQSDVPPPVPDQPRSPTPQPRPPSPLSSKIYKGPLYTVIPQPHFLPSLPCPPPSLTEGMLANLIPPSFQSWLAKDGTPAQDQAAAAAEFSSDTWGRAAWIIPVRGRAPWDGCSAAVVSLRPIKERKKRIIVWTPASLRSFWTQMAGFRDTKRVGSLSMSFEAVPGKPSRLEVPKQTSELKASRSFEFIKLYHDARVSLKLRTILQVLEFADEDRYGIDADVPREGELGSATVRRLLGASTRLALLDSTGHIVLIS